MYRLFAEHYDDTCPQQFAVDLAGKDFVIELRADGVLAGFSTVALMSFGEGGTRRAIFSGDTIVDHRHWGDQALAQAFCRLAGRLKARAPRAPLYWFLISKGHRTYRYLSAFARSYYPSVSAPTPPQVRAWVDELAERRFGAAYRREDGIVRFAPSRGQLKPQYAAARDALHERAEVRFFFERNPGCHLGDELCCLTALEADNLRSLARRAFLQGLHDTSPVALLSSDLGKRRALPAIAAAGTGDAERAAPDAAAA